MREIDRNMQEAMKLVSRSTTVVELEKIGVKLTRQQFRRWCGCYPENVLERISDLTRHIEIVGPNGEALIPAEALQ